MVINSQNTVYIHKTQAHKPHHTRWYQHQLYTNGMELHVEDRDFLYFRTYYSVCSSVHSRKTKPHLTKCQVRVMFTVCLPCENYMKQYQTHKTRDTRKHKVHILYTVPLCNINAGVWGTLSIKIMYLLFHADISKLILQVGKAHNLHSAVLLVYRHSWLSRKCSN